MKDLCKVCGLSKPVEDLMKDRARPKGYRNKCLVCLRAEKKIYYATVTKHNKQTPRTPGVLWDQPRKEYLNDLRSKTPCTDCGNNFHWCAMDFDHLPGNKKLFNIMAKYRDVSWELLQNEIAKCEIVCSNCHRVRTRDRLLNSQNVSKLV